MTYEEHSTEEEAPEDLGVLEGDEGLPEAGTNLAAVALEILLDKGNLLDNVQVRGVEVADPAEVGHGLVPLALGEEPAGRLLDPEGSDEKHTGRDELHSEGNNPLGPARRKGGADTIVDPEADKATDLPSQLINTDETASNSGRGEFRDV